MKNTPSLKDAEEPIFVDSETMHLANKLFAAIDVWRVYRDYERLNLIDSFYNFMHYAFNALKKRI